MTDLKALRREIALQISPEGHGIDLIDSALLQYAEAVLGEPSTEQEALAWEMPHSTDRQIRMRQSMFNAMAAQRLKEVK